MDYFQLLFRCFMQRSSLKTQFVFMFLILNLTSHIWKKLQLSPDQASYQTMREFLDQIQSERGLSDRTINMIISYLQFFQTYVLHKDWDKTQIPFRVFPTYLPYAPFSG